MSWPSAMSRLQASCSATYAPQIDAVLVPPSAWSTSQSTVICRSPTATRSVTVRSERAMRRWISWVRPDCFPFAASRLARSGVDPGSIEYSAVTHPLPEPRSHGGIRSSTEAVHRTRVRPIETSTEPGAKTVKSRSKLTGRSSSSRRPSLRSVLGSTSLIGVLLIIRAPRDRGTAQTRSRSPSRHGPRPCRCPRSRRRSTGTSSRRRRRSSRWSPLGPRGSDWRSESPRP